MTIAAAVVRVQELQQLLHGPMASRPAAPPQGAFAAALAGAAPSDAGAGAAPLSLLAVGAPVGGTPGTGVSGVPYADEINAAAARHKLDPALLAALIRQESNFDPDAVSPAGARGLTQLMPGTAAGLGVSDPTNPGQAIEGGARYLRQQLDAFGNDPSLALAAYNAGPGAVQRHGGVPPYAETQAYVRRVQEYAAEYRRASAPAAAALSAPVTAASPARPTSLDYSIL